MPPGLRGVLWEGPPRGVPPQGDRLWWSDAFIVLLVDSEGPVDPRHTPWEHLRTRDHWNQPAAVADDQVHLMVQCMEAWFLADRDALTDFYGPDFNDNALPSNPDIEHIAKTDVIRALENATRHTSTKGRYHKTYHGFKLLGLIDPIRVRGASTHANRLCAVLVARVARQ